MYIIRQWILLLIMQRYFIGSCITIELLKRDERERELRNIIKSMNLARTNTRSHEVVEMSNESKPVITIRKD